MKRQTIKITVASALALACAPALAQAAPDMQDLMRIAFPGWRSAAGERVQTVPLRGHEGGPLDPTDVQVDPQLVLRTGSDTLTLIVTMIEVVGEYPITGELSYTALSAYQFKRHGTHWRLAARQDGFTYQQTTGLGRLAAIRLSDKELGFTVPEGRCRNNDCGATTYLYQLKDGGVSSSPIATINVDSSNGAEGCSRRLHPLIASTPSRNEPDANVFPEKHDCYEIKAAWSIAPSAAAPGDLTIVYSGAVSRAAKEPGPPVAIAQQQVLRYRDGTYQTVSGEDPTLSVHPW